MVDTQELRQKINASGYKLAFLADQCGLTYQGFLNKIENRNAFKVSEAAKLKSLLGLNDAEFNQIFFADTVDAVST